ncbi:hypothetical protein E2C01_043118 [Portunus trituberculatus]|uniref:Uncharacterized protein n=1 Tax=Portunus trituberculatus TaxID=210409 RepID=A0A5B7FNL3_PORTR|nr:hypothetical protein [Portunus trituberculatus]
MVTPNPASESPSGEGTRGPVGDQKCLDTSLNFSFIIYCNIRDLLSNFQSVERHHSSTKPHLLFLTETRLSEGTDYSSFYVPSYFLCPHFRSNAGCCVYVRND